MVVYVVEGWETYEGSHIVGIFRNEADANAICEKINDARGVEFWHGATVSPYRVVEDAKSILSSVA